MSTGKLQGQKEILVGKKQMQENSKISKHWEGEWFNKIWLKLRRYQ